MKSRFLNVSPRAYIRQKDCVNNIPPIIRTGYQNEIRDENTPFSENDNTIVFGENKNLLAPYMLPLKNATLSKFIKGDLFTTSTLQSSTAFLSKKIENDPIFPFKEGSNPAGYSSSQDEGFPEEDYPGFSSPDSDKSSIIFNIGTSADFDVLKLNAGDSRQDSAGPFFGRSGSGFLYYNKSLGSWEDVGLRDPSTKNIVTYDPILTIDHTDVSTSDNHRIVAGDNRFLCQFTSSPYSITSEGPNFVPERISKLATRGYENIGEPTSFFGAPYSPRYHATEESSFRMSDYIKHPFVVDRISVSIPVRAFRTQTPPTPPVAPLQPDDGFGRDIENYVFFVYVQNRSNATPDSLHDVSSSIRHLIAKESFCFYNANTLAEVRPGLVPMHNPGKAYRFSMAGNAAISAAAVVVTSSDRTVDLTFRPATFNAGFGTISKLAASEDGPGPTFLTGSVFIQNFWRGGQKASGSLGSIVLPATSTTSASLNIRLGAESPDLEDLNCQPSQRPLVSSFWEGSTSVIISGSGLLEAGNEVSTVSNNIDSARPSPVVLFPEDEIIFGIDAGTNPNLLSPGREKSGLDKSVLDLTGSRLIIRSGHAQVTFFGTQISDRHEHLPSLNQHLGSDAVSETIHEQGPFDQFDIYDSSILSASYVDGVFSGNFLKGLGRRRVSLASAGQAWITGSLQRNVRHFGNDFLYFDSYVPDANFIANKIENAVVSDDGVVILLRDATNGFAIDNDRSSNILLRRGFTYEGIQGPNAKTKDAIVTLRVPAVGQESFGKESAKFVLYYNGFNPSVRNPSKTLSYKNYKGAASIRYGLSNVRTTSPSHVFRRDHYGHCRDMLEQPKITRFVQISSKKDQIQPPVVVATFVSASSDIPVTPSITQCSNLSEFCTSSVPFDDGRQNAANRGLLPDPKTITFGAQNLIFGVDITNTETNMVTRV